MKIDVKSAVLGLCVGIMLVLVTGADGDGEPKGYGRYQIATFLAGGQPNAVILDTRTGKLWGSNLSRHWHDSGEAVFFGVKDGNK